MFDFLKGWKTYLVVLLGLVYVVLKYIFDGVLDSQFLIELLAIAGLRAGISDK